MRGPRLRPAHWRARAIAGRRLCLQRLGGRSNDSLSITLTRAIDTAETVQWVQLILQCACYLMRYNTPLLQLRAWRMGFERCQTSHSQTELLGRIISAKRAGIGSPHQYRAQHACYPSMIWSCLKLSRFDCWSDPQTLQKSPLDAPNFPDLAQGSPAPAHKRVISCYCMYE